MADPTARAAPMTEARRALARHGVWAFLCMDCAHPASDHRLRGDWRVEPRIYVCLCGCEKPEKASYAALGRSQWQVWLDQHPDWSPR